MNAMKPLLLTVAIAAGVLALATAVRGQAPAGYRGSRLADGKPDLNGIWQNLSTANWNLETHAAQQSPVLAMGALGAIPPGMGVVEGGPIPYKPEALKQRDDNRGSSITQDPLVKCYLPGIPRATYVPMPLEIIQNEKSVLIVYEWAGASRTIPIRARTGESPIDTWMGDSVGKWENDTFVVDVASFNDKTWFDRSGNYHSDALHVVERYTPLDANTTKYEATIEDAKVFTKPWKISLNLYRVRDKDVRLMEFKCVDFVEELMYGGIRKRPGTK
jgi:hypothetical protein